MSNTAVSILVDLDGTLAFYDTWRGIEHIGEPIPTMLDFVKAKLATGKTVGIFTARAATPECIPHIRAWLDKHGLEAITTITNAKDFHTAEIYDDRAFGVKLNTGLTREWMMALQLLQVAKAIGVEVKNDHTPNEVTELCLTRILKMKDALDVAKAQIDSAHDALSYVKIEESGGPRSDLNRAKQSVAKAHKLISEIPTL